MTDGERGIVNSVQSLPYMSRTLRSRVLPILTVTDFTNIRLRALVWNVILLRVLQVIPD